MSCVVAHIARRDIDWFGAGVCGWGREEVAAHLQYFKLARKLAKSQPHCKRVIHNISQHFP